MAPFVLRRKKEIALKQMLPSKTSKLELVPFCPSSKTLYNSILTDHAAHLSGEKKMKENEAKNVFFNLRKAANNPLLLRTRWKEEEDVKYLIKWTMVRNGMEGRAKRGCVGLRIRQPSIRSDLY